MQKRKEIEFSAKGVSQILIQDEMCSCLCTTNFPPNEGFCLSLKCFNSNRVSPTVIKVACAS